ncbi:MAG: ATP-binding protein [Pelobacteraceae bacterium]
MNESMLAMEFEAHFRNVDMARGAFQGICAACFGTDTESAADLTMAVNEAMNNAVEHAGSTTIKLEVAWDCKSLRVFVISGGPRFDPVVAAADLDDEDMLERDEGGYGLYLIRELVDRFEYEYRDLRNIWKLTKNTKL